MRHFKYTLERRQSSFNFWNTEIRLTAEAIKKLDQNDDNKHELLNIKINKSDNNAQQITWEIENTSDENKTYIMNIPRLFSNVYFKIFENFPDLTKKK